MDFLTDCSLFRINRERVRKLERKKKLPEKMSDSGGNPHLEGIISDFEGL